MPRYQDKVFSFESPPTWVDRSAVVHTAPFGTAQERKEDPPLSMTMSHELMRPGDTLRMHADKQILMLGRQLEDLDLLESRETELGGLPAIFLRVTWTTHYGDVEQTVTMVERTSQERGHFATLFSTSAPLAKAEAARPVFERILKSVRFSQRNIAPPPSRHSPQSSPQEPPPIPMPGYRGPSTRR